MKKSEKALEKFIEKMRQDEDLQKRLNEAAKAYTGDVNDAGEAVRQTIIPIAEEAGYRFSAEEYVARVKSEMKHKLANREMDEGELSGVVGGIGDASAKTESGDISLTEIYYVTINVFIGNDGTKF